MYTPSIKIARCEVFRYIKEEVPINLKREIDIGLERNAIKKLNLYRNNCGFLVQVGNIIYFRIIGRISTRDMRIGLNYLFNHNSPHKFNNLCFDCSIKDGPLCTMKSISKAISYMEEG